MKGILGIGYLFITKHKQMNGFVSDGWLTCSQQLLNKK